MARKSRKQITKLFDKQCFFCKEDNYALLDAHRIVPGSEGGKYVHENNVLTLCSNCHRRVHAGDIVIDRKYPSTGKSLWTLHCWINGQEQWIPYQTTLGSSNTFTSPPSAT